MSPVIWALTPPVPRKTLLSKVTKYVEVSMLDVLSIESILSDGQVLGDSRTFLGHFPFF